MLDHEIRAELHLQGAMEFKIGRDLVQNELEAGRVDNYAVQQFMRAQILARLDVEQFDLRDTPLLRFPIPKEKEGEQGYRTRLRPAFCVMFLNNLKEKIEERGLRPDEDLDFLSLVYGNEITALGEAIVVRYKIFTASERMNKVDKKTAERRNRDFQALVLGAVEREIKSQKERMALEDIREALECASDWVVLPPDHILDRIERYRTAKARKSSRVLGDLETIRRLKGKT